MVALAVDEPQRRTGPTDSTPITYTSLPCDAPEARPPTGHGGEGGKMVLGGLDETRKQGTTPRRKVEPSGESGHVIVHPVAMFVWVVVMASILCTQAERSGSLHVRSRPLKPLK
jgi:hypothetical protein